MEIVFAAVDDYVRPISKDEDNLDHPNPYANRIWAIIAVGKPNDPYKGVQKYMTVWGKRSSTLRFSDVMVHPIVVNSKWGAIKNLMYDTNTLLEKRVDRMLTKGYSEIHDSYGNMEAGEFANIHNCFNERFN